MHRPIRRKDRQITEEEARALLCRAEYGILSTVGEDGQPYGIPLSFVALPGGIYFHCARTGQKIDNMKNEQRVSFCVVGDTQPFYETDFSTYYESAVVYGRASLVEDAAEKTEALTELCRKYLPDHMDKAPGEIEKSIKVTAVYKITIDHITGKAKRQTPSGEGKE